VRHEAAAVPLDALGQGAAHGLPLVALRVGLRARVRVRVRVRLRVEG